MLLQMAQNAISWGLEMSQFDECYCTQCKMLYDLMYWGLERSQKSRKLSCDVFYCAGPLLKGLEMSQFAAYGVPSFEGS